MHGSIFMINEKCYGACLFDLFFVYLFYCILRHSTYHLPNKTIRSIDDIFQIIYLIRLPSLLMTYANHLPNKTTQSIDDIFQIIYLE